MKVIMEMQLELGSRVSMCSKRVFVSSRAARLRWLLSFRAVARIAVCPYATRAIMGETAEPAKERSPKCRKRDSEGKAESAVAETPRVEREKGVGGV